MYSLCQVTSDGENSTEIWHTIHPLNPELICLFLKKKIKPQFCFIFIDSVFQYVIIATLKTQTAQSTATVLVLRCQIPGTRSSS